MRPCVAGFGDPKHRKLQRRATVGSDGAGSRILAQSGVAKKPKLNNFPTMTPIDDLLQLMRTRRSVRKLSSEPLPEGCEAKLLEAFVWAPSGGNKQPWHVRIVHDASLKHRLSAAAHSQPSVQDAPVVFVVCADLDRAFGAYKERGRELYCLQDTAAAVQNMLLAAHAMGLGTCWVGAFEEEAVRDALALPTHLRPVAMVPVGVPKEQPRAPSRRPVAEIAQQDT